MNGHEHPELFAPQTEEEWEAYERMMDSIDRECEELLQAEGLAWDHETDWNAGEIAAMSAP